MDKDKEATIVVDDGPEQEKYELLKEKLKYKQAARENSKKIDHKQNGYSCLIKSINETNNAMLDLNFHSKSLSSNSGVLCDAFLTQLCVFYCFPCCFKRAICKSI